MSRKNYLPLLEHAGAQSGFLEIRWSPDGVRAKIHWPEWRDASNDPVYGQLTTVTCDNLTLLASTVDYINQKLETRLLENGLYEVSGKYDSVNGGDYPTYPSQQIAHQAEGVISDYLEAAGIILGGGYINQDEGD